MIQFKAVVSSVKIDKEGQVKITFTVPLSHRTEAMSVGVLTETVLNVSVEKEEEGN
jgi:hypothetical protein